MTRSVSSTYSAMRRVSRSAITKTSHGLTCVNTPILGTLQLPRQRRTTRPELPVNDLVRPQEPRRHLTGPPVLGQRAWLTGRDANGLQPTPDRARRLGVATAKRQHAAGDRADRLGGAPGPPQQLVRRNPPHPVDELVV